MTKPLSLIIPVRAMARLAAGETVREAAAALSGTVERGEMVAASAGHTQCHARQDRRACAAQEPGGAGGVFRLQVAQIAHLMPPQAAVETRARDIRGEELPHHRRKIVDRHQQRLAQDDRHRLLRRGQGRLQPVRCVAAVLHTVAVLPFVYGLPVCRENDSLDRFQTLQTPKPRR